jgi:hypothetical protein
MHSTTFTGVWGQGESLNLNDIHFNRVLREERQRMDGVNILREAYLDSTIVKLIALPYNLLLKSTAIELISYLYDNIRSMSRY